MVENVYLILIAVYFTLLFKRETTFVFNYEFFFCLLCVCVCVSARKVPLQMDLL